MSTGERREMALQLGRYWPQTLEVVLALPVPQLPRSAAEPLPPKLSEIKLPDWAQELGSQGAIPVPSHYANGPSWESVDWWQVADWYLHGRAERAHEAGRGSIHSYSSRLAGWPAEMWSRAWVNRIACFLRRWAARLAGQDEATLHGPFPTHRIVVTHDVDAIRKTLAIRFKQSAFQFFNGFRSLFRGDFPRAVRRFAGGTRFLIGRENYWRFDYIRELERAANVSSVFHFYGAAQRRGMEKLLDPSYDISSPSLAALMKKLEAEGCVVGLHQAFNSWRDSTRMMGEKARVEAAAGHPITHCRQHWLRFSWNDTWAAQQAAGLTADATLGFNDRPGFRNGCALGFQPPGLTIRCLPMVLMDSHVYDYAEESQASRLVKMKAILDEVKTVGGEATVIWHTQVLGGDYGWEQGFRDLLSLAA